jgi:2-methylcitrate dehydratase PrpD
MILQTWAQEFAAGIPADAQAARTIDLHVADVAIAFFAGARTSEAVSLAQVLAGREPFSAPPVRQAAAVASIVRHTECDDIHMASCMTPGSAVIPVALAFGALAGATGGRIDDAIRAGYATGIRLGLALSGTEALGSGIWPTYFAAPLMAAATASVCLGLDIDKTASALAIAAAGAGGRAGRPLGSPSGRWLAFGEAVAKGCSAAEAATAGFRGDPDLVSADWLAALAPGVAVRPEALTAGSPADLIGLVGLKPFVAARQTINAVHAFQQILVREVLDTKTIDRVEIGVPTVNAAMVSRPPAAGDRLGTISNMAIQIAAAAVRPGLLYDVERQGVPDAEVAAFAKRVEVVADPELDSLLPNMWAGRIEIVTNGREITETCAATPGDNRDGFEPLIREKLSRMVPQPYREICAAQIEPHDPENRASRRGALWQAMLGALRTSA